jgi:hypothetical protein
MLWKISGQTERSPVPREIMAGYIPSGHRPQETWTLAGIVVCIGDLVLVHTHPPRSAVDLLAKNQGHIASGVLQ